MITFYPRDCDYHEYDMCKMQLQEQLKATFSQIPSITVVLEFDNKRSKSIDIKICTITEMTETEEETIPSDTKMKAKQAVMPFAAPKKLARN
ncbi:unnamed protein product, partial [Rotaria sp. Silwood1]